MKKLLALVLLIGAAECLASQANFTSVTATSDSPLTRDRIDSLIKKMDESGLKFDDIDGLLTDDIESNAQKWRPFIDSHSFKSFPFLLFPIMRYTSFNQIENAIVVTYIGAMTHRQNETYRKWIQQIFESNEVSIALVLNNGLERSYKSPNEIKDAIAAARISLLCSKDKKDELQSNLLELKLRYNEINQTTYYDVYARNDNGTGAGKVGNNNQFTGKSWLPSFTSTKFLIPTGLVALAGIYWYITKQDSDKKSTK